MIALFAGLALLAVPQESTVAVRGLQKPVRIVVDTWGIPHLYAETEHDLFFAQGYQAARDRLWQLDLWRRQGEGRLSEAFGARFVEQDRAALLFLYRGDLRREFQSYHPRGEQILQAFAEGINAYVDRTREHPELLPVEFRLTRSTPGHWTARTPLIRIFALTRNLSREVALAQLVHRMGPQAVEKVSNFQPPAKLVVPEGLDLSLIEPSVIKAYTLARSGVVFQRGDLASNLEAGDRERLAALLSAPASGEPRFESNNWTLSGRLTPTGKPLVAGDPHRAQSVPSLRYIAHLVGPGWNVIGAGEPALPGISLGHNERIAYALTVFSFADEEDLYVYDTNAANPSQVRYRGQWEDLRVLTERIPVKGAAPVEVTLKFTRHGPVLSEDAAHHKLYALRAAYLEHEGTAAYLASLRVDQARNWQEFTAAMEKHFTPSENMVYADVEGNIGWFGCSIAPVRRTWTGLLPVPGDGRYEWRGFLDPAKLPRLSNPPAGLFASANQYDVPESYPFADLSAHEWADPYRFQRIAEVLREARGFGVQESARLQYDELSLPAREVLPLLEGVAARDADGELGLRLLRGWKGVLSRDSGAAALFEVWMADLHQAVFALYVPEPARAAFGSGSRTVLLRLLRSPDAAFGPDPVAGRSMLLSQSLSRAVAALRAKLGPDPAAWQWGKLHHMTYQHDLSKVADAKVRETLDVGPLPVGGDAYTVHNTGYRASDYNQNTGASYREIIDLADFDRSLTLNSPGQSGDPASPHYRDLFPLWAEGRFVPLLYSRAKVMAAAEQIITLTP